MDPETRKAIVATRQVLKSTMRTLRTLSQFLADLEEKLAQPDKEGTANGYHEDAAKEISHRRR